MPLITTGRLELRPFRDQDAAELHEVFSDPETHTIGEGPFTSLDRGLDHRRAGTERRHDLLWYAVLTGADGRLLGNCGILNTAGQRRERARSGREGAV